MTDEVVAVVAMRTSGDALSSGWVSISSGAERLTGHCGILGKVGRGTLLDTFSIGQRISVKGIGAVQNACIGIKISKVNW